MWLFLLTEIMFFGGMFFAYLLYRNWYYDAFVVASNQLSIPLGATTSAPARAWLTHCAANNGSVASLSRSSRPAVCDRTPQWP